MPETISYRAFLVSLPLGRPIPVGRERWTRRRVVLLRGEDIEGRFAWGEAAPLDGFGPEVLDDVVSALERPDWKTQPMPASLECAIGTVEWGLVALDAGRSFGFQANRQPLSELESVVLFDREAGFTGRGKHIKVKVGREDSTDIASRIRSLMDADDSVIIRLDGNGLMDRDGAIRLLDDLSDYTEHIAFFEEPWHGCFEDDWHGQFPVPIAIDESLKGDNWRHADVCVLKPSLMGHPASVVRLAEQIQETGRRVVVSSAFESRVGMIMVSRLAALLGDAAPGLGTYDYLVDDWGGRASLWDGPTISMDSMPPVPAPPGSMDLQDAIFESGLEVLEIR